MVAFLSARAAKSARKHAHVTHGYSESLFAVFFRQGWDPIWADITMLIVGNIFFFSFCQSCSLRLFLPTLNLEALPTDHQL